MWPQVIFLAIMCIDIGLVVALHGKPRPNYSFWGYLFGTAITLGLLHWGGFFDALLAPR